MNIITALYMWSTFALVALFVSDAKGRNDELYDGLLWLAKVMLVLVLIYTGCVVGQLIATLVAR